MSSAILYLNVLQVLALHKRSLERYGGADGVRDMRLLESAVFRPMQSAFGEDDYPDLFHTAAALLEGLAKNHPFFDGNKRTAFAAAAVFTELNGYALNCSEIEAANFILQIAGDTRKDFSVIVGWLKKNSKKI